MSPTVNPLAEWRLLIKAMGGPTGAAQPYTVTINEPTNRYSRTTSGLISSAHLPHYQIAPGGPYTVVPIIVPHDPEYGTGGSFWRMTSGPYIGWLLSKWTNTLSDDFGPYGDITVNQDEAFDRGPGATIATIYHPNAHLAGASLNYNSPGEMHFTMLVDDPLVNIPEPKRTHYAIEFWNGSAWEEVFAGWIWDMDATDTEVVYYGIDYLAAFKYVVDERFSPSSPDRAEPTGSKYERKSVRYIIQKLLHYAVDIPYSIVGFIEVGDVAAELDLAPIWKFYTTFGSILDLSVGLIDSYRAGTGIQTRIKVVKVGSRYQIKVENDPGQPRDDLLLEYKTGGLVQGYRVIPFGPTWASRLDAISKDQKGVKINYEAADGAIDQGAFGRITQGAVLIETEDLEDLKRRAHQMAVDAAAQGKQISVGLKVGSYRPLEAFDICDWVPVNIVHGGVNTHEMYSQVFGLEGEDAADLWTGYWTIYGITWESYDDGHWMTGLNLFPKNGKPYVPAMAEPPYTNHLTRGGAAWWAAEITGVEFSPAFMAEDQLVQVGWTSDNLPTWSGIDPTKEFIILAGGAIAPDESGFTQSPGWVRDVHQTGPDGGSGLFAMHKIFAPGAAASVTPQISHDYSGSDRNWWSGTMIGYYNRAGQNIGVRQTWNAGGGVAWPGPTEIVFPLAPLLGSTIVVWGTNGEYFSSSPGIELTDNFKAFIGDGKQFIQWAPYGGYWESSAAYRIPYYDIDPTEPINNMPSMEVGVGPPPPSDAPSTEQYTDSTTGIVYEYNWSTGLWAAVPGTGNTASGLYDFTFSASTQWVINHTMSGYPRVTLRGTDGEVIYAEVVYNSSSQITINFSSAVAGSAHLG